MKRIVLLLFALIAFSCTQEEKISKADIQAYEKELKEKIEVAKVTIVQMKIELEKMGDSLETEYSDRIDDFENRLNAAEKDYESFKNITKKELWTSSKAELDSMIGYLELEIDSTKNNIDQMIK